MGICICKSTIIPKSVEQTKLAIAQAIDRGNINKLKSIFRQPSQSNAYQIPLVGVDDYIITIQGVGLSPLAYASRLGDASIWKCLIEDLKSSMDCFMMSFIAIRKTPMDIICENGLFEVLKYLLPIYIKHIPPVQIPSLTEDDSDRDSVFAENGPLSPVVVRNTQWAILRAVEHGHLEWVKYIFEFFKDKSDVPKELNIHIEDERTGETAALIAARNADLAMLIYLHSECNVSLDIQNKRNEGILQVTWVASKKNKPEYFQVVKYLVETAKVELKYEYEETLLMWKDQKISQYLELQLFDQGIFANKEQLELEYSLTHNRPISSPPDLRMEEKLLGLGSDFNFKEVFQQELESSNVSSIFPLGTGEASSMAGAFTPVSCFSRTPRIGFTPRMTSNVQSNRTPRID